MDVQTELNCLGFFGFGGGWARARSAAKPGIGTNSYCNQCPLNKDCWEKHKARVRGIFPAMTAAFDQMADEHRGPALIAAWFEKHGVADPYTRVLVGNSADGLMVALTGKPVDRGQFATVPWPFVTH